MITSTLTSKGQTTIPQPVRQALGIGVNDLIGYEFEGDRVVLRPIKNRLLELRGSIKPHRKPEDFAAIRKTVAGVVGRAAAKRG
jgi:AbrB family looped-hinge helix DNA binding protein